jgi:hypothetical protein
MSVPDAELASAVRRLTDDASVAQVVLRYADGLDRREFEQVTACFDPGGSVRATRFEGTFAEYLPHLYDNVRSFGATQHFVGNQLRRLDGDVAHTETYCIAHHFEDAAGTQEGITVGVRYVDELQRRGDAWLITHREVDTMWRRIGDAFRPR